MTLANVLYIDDIAPSHLWIPPVVALGAYLLPIFLNKVFNSQPDQFPLSTLRTQLAYVHHNIARVREPRFYRFLHVDVKDNLYLAVFIVAITVLKNSNSDLRGDRLFLFASTCTLCAMINGVRKVNSFALSSISQNLPRTNFFLDKIASVCKGISSYTAPSQV